MSGKEAKQRRKLVRGAIEKDAQARYVVTMKKANAFLRKRAAMWGLIFALIPANIWTAFQLLKEIMK